MQEFLATAAKCLVPATLAGNALLALALIPTQFIVDLGKNKIQQFVDQVLPYHPEKVFYDAFLRTIKDHKRRHDYIADRITTQVVYQLKHDKARFYDCLNSLRIPQNLISSSDPFPAQLFAEKLIKEYRFNLAPENQELLYSIIRDCMNDYRKDIYRLMNEKGILLQSMQILMNLQDQATLFETMLSNTATQADILILKDALLTAIRQNDASKLRDKSLAEYDQMITGQYRYIEFTAGFSPRINTRDIRMNMSDVFINLECTNKNPTASTLFAKEEFDVVSVVLRNRFNVFLGDPGCGKTTLLKKIAFDLSSPQNRTSGSLSNFVPLYFRLAEYARFYQGTHKGIAEYLEQTFYQYRNTLFGITQRERSLIFLMDGLDEIADIPLRIQVVEQVNTFVFANPQYIYFITSRIVGYRDAALNGIFSTYRLEPLNDGKIETFIYQWYMAIEENTDNDKSEHDKHEAAQEATRNLIVAIEENSSVKKLATNPLLLTIITLIHLRGGRLPNKRVELYDICAETFLQHWINRRVDNADAILDRDILVELLSRIAFYIHENYANGLIPEDIFQQQFLQYYQEIFDGRGYSLLELKRACRQFIDFIRKETGIFAEKGQDENGKNLFGFLHLTFEEYFAAIEFKRRVAQNNLALKDYIYSARWQEIILLCAALFGGQSGTGRYDASRFVEKILHTKEIFPPMNQNLRLVLSIMADDVRLLPNCEKNIWARLETILQESSTVEIEEELEMLMLSVEYGDRLRQQTEQWLKSSGRKYINTVVWLLDCEDSPWDDLLMKIPDYPNFSYFLEWFAFHGRWPDFKQDKDLVQKWVNGITEYLNKQTDLNSETRWMLLMQLGTFISVFDKRPQKVLFSEKDQLVLHAYLCIERIFQIYDYQLGGDHSKEKLKYEIANVTYHFGYMPRFKVHNEVLDMKAQVSQMWLEFLTIGKDQHYYLLVLISETPDLYKYIVLDMFLEEIQLGTYAVPLTVDEFIKIFGFDTNEIASKRFWLHKFLPTKYQSSEEELLQAWEDGWFGKWDRLSFGPTSFPDTNAEFFTSMRRWVKSHGQEAPIHLLLAQVILNRYDSKKNHITQKALNNAISYYMAGRVPEDQRDEAYSIIEKAVQAQNYHTKRIKLT